MEKAEGNIMKSRTEKKNPEGCLFCPRTRENVGHTSRCTQTLYSFMARSRHCGEFGPPGAAGGAALATPAIVAISAAGAKSGGAMAHHQHRIATARANVV
jgi:hypothetical protein